MKDMPAPQDDGLYIPTVGKWSRDKHWFLEHYIGAFTNSMKKKKWNGLHYIDLFAGAGIERIRGSGTLCWGSPMIAAQAPYPFAGLYLCERTRKRYLALKSRIERISDCKYLLINGDANEAVYEIVQRIPHRGLCLAFLDPFGLHLEFETLEALSKVRCDLVVFFPDYVDALRNWEHNYLDNPNSNLDRCLGTGANWREILNDTPHDRIPETLRDLYVGQIRKLGYSEFAYERIEAKKHPLYILILCSRHSLAVKLWERVSQKRRDGQRMMLFDD